MADFITIIPQSTFNDTQKLLKDVNAIADAVERVNEEAKKIKFPSEARNVIKQTNDEISKTQKLISDTEVVRKRQETSIRNVTVARSKENKEIQRNRVEATQLNRVQKEEAILTSNLTGAYQRLNLRRTQASKRLRDLIASEKASNREIERAQREFNRLDGRVQRANRAVRDFTSNVGNYRSALPRTIALTRQLSGAFGIGGAALFGARVLQNIVKTTKELDSLNKALEKVAGSQEEVALQQEFITKTAESYGVEIKNLTSEYTKFLAGLKGTNLEGERGREIFDSVVKASAALGRSQEQTTGTLDALTQIISKGTVQAEELRGQLGDRLPGAFNIMARAIGVTVEELNEMLKQGEVIADEVLPKFAKELEKTFGIENLERVDTLVAAQNRLSNEWTAFIELIAGSDTFLSNAFGAILTFMSGLLGSITDISTAIKEAFQTEATKLATKQLDFYAKKTQETVRILNTYDNALTRLNAALDLQSRIETRLGKILLERGANTEFAAETAKELIDIISQPGTDKEILKQVEAVISLKDGEAELIRSARARFKAAQQVIKITEDQAAVTLELGKITDGTNKKTKETEQITKNSIEAFEKSIKALKEQQKGLDITGQEYSLLSGLIKLTETAYKALNGELDKTEKKNFDLAKSLQKLNQEFQQQNEQLKEAAKQFITDSGASFFENAGLREFGKLVDGTFDDILTGINLIEDPLERSRAGFAAYFQFIGDAAQDAFQFIEQSQAASIQKQLDDLNTQKEIALALNEGNAEAIAAINEQAAAQETEIKQKQAEQNKQNALFNIVINTAQGVVAALASVPPNVPLSIAIGAIGALQAALVSAQPIPQFKDGVENFKGGLAVVGDGGVPEVISTPDKGMFVTPDKPTLVNLPKGSDVIPNLREFDLNLNRILLNSRIEPIKKKDNSITADQMNAIFARNMRKMTALNLNMDQNGFALSVQRGLSKTNIERNRVIFKGQKV